MKRYLGISFLLAFFFITGFAVKSYLDKESCDLIFSNPKEYLDIETYDGGGEGLHPKSLYFPEGWNGSKFWFVFTPYKGMNEAIENPCIYTSNNGYDFTPVYSAYPLDNISLSKDDEYNSDPHLVFNSDLNRIECWWRRVYTGTYPDTGRRYSELLYRSYTLDGTIWSEKELIFEYKNKVEATRGVICPVVHYEDGRYLIWVSCSEDIDGAVRYIDCYEYTNEGDINKINRSSLKDCIPSHFDVLKKDSLYYLCTQDVGEEGFPYKLYVASSPYADFESCGLVFTTGPRENWDGGRLYRPSLTLVDNEWWLYYSAYDAKGVVNHIGLLQFDSWAQIEPKVVVKKEGPNLLRRIYNFIMK